MRERVSRRSAAALLAAAMACVGGRPNNVELGEAAAGAPAGAIAPQVTDGSSISTSAVTVLDLATYPPAAAPAAELRAAVDPAPANLAMQVAVPASSWSASGGSCTVRAGGLACQASGDTLVLTSTSAALALDLDAGFNDMVDLVLVLPAAGAGSLSVTFATDTLPQGGQPALPVPAAALLADGAAHRLRLDMGTVQRWRGRLAGLELRWEPPTAGAELGLAGAWVGDDEGDVYAIDPANEPTDQTFSQLTSKRFRVMWTPAVTAQGFTPEQARVTLRNLEEAWQVHRKVIGMQHDPTVRDGKLLKSNMLTWNPGYWCGGAGLLNIDVSGLRGDPPSWVIPHELMHAFQFASPAGMEGMYWESHANYGRERWIAWYDSLFPDQSGLDSFYGMTSALFYASGRNYYLGWPLFLYLDENPDGLAALSTPVTPKMWADSRAKESIWQALARHAPGVDVAQVAGLWARRNATWAYRQQKGLHAADRAGDDQVLSRRRRAPLQRRGDSDIWYASLPDASPMQGSYVVHLLTRDPDNTSGVVQVALRSLPLEAQGADHRAALVAVRDEAQGDGQERATPVFAPGTVQVTLAPQEQALLLAVAATPKTWTFGGQDDVEYPTQSHPSKTRFPYEVAVVGASALPLMPTTPEGAGAAHPNGGGFVASTAQVAATAFVGPEARVLGQAQITGAAKVVDQAWVTDNAQVGDHAEIGGQALVRGGSVVAGSARVGGQAVVSGGQLVGAARVLERANVSGEVQVGDHATALGFADVYGSPPVAMSGDAVLDGEFAGGIAVANGFQFGFIPYAGTLPAWVAARHAPAGISASYDLNDLTDGLARCRWGTGHGLVVGAPICWQGDGQRQGFLSFAAAQDYVLLPRRMADFSGMSMALWARLDAPAGGDASPAVRGLWGMGGEGVGQVSLQVVGPDLVLLGASGTAAAAVRATWPAAAPPVGAWAHIAVALDGAVAELFVAAQSRGEQPFALSTRAVMAPDTPSGRQLNVLGRDVDGHSLLGALDSIILFGQRAAQPAVADAMQAEPAAATPIGQCSWQPKPSRTLP